MSDADDPRDDAVDAAWRAHMRDAPPARLDDAILAAAHRAVQSVPLAAATPPRAPARPPRWRAFAPLAAAAALGAIAFGVLQLAPRDDATERITGDTPSGSARKPMTPQQDARPAAPAASVAAPLVQGQGGATSAPLPPPAPQAFTPPPAAPPAPPRTASRAAPKRDQSPRQEQPAADAREDTAADGAAGRIKDQRAEPSPFPAAPRAAPAPRDAQREDARTADRGVEATAQAPRRNAADALAGAQRNDVAPAAPPVAAAAGAPAARAKVAGARGADDFIADIRRQRNEGHDAEAVRTLGAFRAAYADADARLPEDLRAWARGVGRVP